MDSGSYESRSDFMETVVSEGRGEYPSKSGCSNEAKFEFDTNIQTMCRILYLKNSRRERCSLLLQTI